MYRVGERENEGVPQERNPVPGERGMFLERGTEILGILGFKLEGDNPHFLGIPSILFCL